jgi:hypothetical protein
MIPREAMPQKNERQPRKVADWDIIENLDN